MQKLEGIANQIREKFDVVTKLRDLALSEARQLTRSCSLAIRAVHRDDHAGMEMHLTDAHNLANKLRAELKNYPGLYYAELYPGCAQGICGSKRHVCPDPQPAAPDS